MTSWSTRTRCGRGPRSYEPAPRLLVIGGAEHFFHGKLLELRAGILEFLRDDELAGP